MLRTHLLIGTVLAGIFSSPAYGAAQSDDDEIIVTGQYLSLDQLNAVKTPTLIINVPQSLSIISEIQMKEQAFTTIGDILRYTPGLSISQGEGHRDAINIRGNQSTADFFLDGLRDDVQYFRPLYNLEKVEILRGSNALLFGRGGAGGVINRVQKRADNSDNFTTLSGSVDTFGAFQLSADTNMPVGETGAFRLNGFYEQLDNHRDFYDGKRYGLNPTVGFDISPKTRVNLSYEYLSDDRVVDRGVPSVSVAGAPDRPLEGFDTTFFGSADENQTTLEANIFTGRVEHELTETLRANVTLRYADYDKLYQNIYVNGYDAAANTLVLDGYQDTTGRENLILQGNLVGEFATGAIGHTLLVGAEVGSQDTSNARNDNVFTANNDDQITIGFTDPLNIPAFSFSNPARNRASDVQFSSFYIQNQVSLTEAFKIVLGARYDVFDIDVTDIAAGGAQFSRRDAEITPRVGAIYKPADNISFYASYSETFLPRSGDQFLTLSLDSEGTRPQFYENKEIGAKWDIRSNLSLTAAVFELGREAFTTVDPADPAQTLIIDGSTTRGFEVQLAGNITDDWFISTGYSYMDGQVEGGALDGNETRQTPENMLSVWNRYDVTQDFGLGLGVTYQSASFVREDNAVEVPGYTRVDAAAYYNLSEDLRVQLNVENLFDVSYFPDAHSNDNISTGKPLNARFTVAKTF
ncbi:TonB-dependent receptor [Robiginitomaculum antarcticum]|uniref:TonB-dependent receptor n=1 Tax=Robiginitomaculum antarcticum TaxID=437507 RepID=UPI00038006AB|nr:TonB-dependent siderophore receptor [Robiginitomaculum antarcticum]